MWSGVQPECAEINCGSPGFLPNGWLEGTRNNLHAKITYRCAEGMTFEGTGHQSTCQVRLIRFYV